MQDPNASNPQIPQPNNTMVRLSSLGGRVLRRVKEQASVQPVTNHYPTGVVGKPVYMYVIQKFPECHIDPAHAICNATPLQLKTPEYLSSK